MTSQYTALLISIHVAGEVTHTLAKQPWPGQYCSPEIAKQEKTAQGSISMRLTEKPRLITSRFRTKSTICIGFSINSKVRTERWKTQQKMGQELVYHLVMQA